LDADLQNDPADIPRLLEKMDEGYDLVSGWRVHRKDKYFTRILPSKIANWLIGSITGVKLHDYGCSLKAYRAEVIKDLRLYGEMHRFIPALASWFGAKIAEIPVQHHPRRFGKSNYSLNRIWRVLLDLITVKFLLSFSTRPLQIFGSMGLVSFIAGFGISIYLTFLKLVYHEHLSNRPLLWLGILLIMLGFQFITLGLLAEMVARTYHESQNKPIYVIRQILG
ncbi:MAG: glycosyltransferase, partial [bacterium]|nr:glycosyltransferase [bacterium]